MLLLASALLASYSLPCDTDFDPSARRSAADGQGQAAAFRVDERQARRCKAPEVPGNSFVLEATVVLRLLGMCSFCLPYGSAVDGRRAMAQKERKDVDRSLVMY